MNESIDRPCLASSISRLGCDIALVITTLCLTTDAFDGSPAFCLIVIVATTPYVAHEFVARKLGHHRRASLVLCLLTMAICVGRLTVGFTLVMLFDRPSPGCNMIVLLPVFEFWIICAQCVVISVFFVYWFSTR